MKVTIEFYADNSGFYRSEFNRELNADQNVLDIEAVAAVVRDTAEEVRQWGNNGVRGKIRDRHSGSFIGFWQIDEDE